MKCPNVEEIVECLLGRASRHELQSWEEHAEQCERCRGLAERYDSARDALVCDLKALTPVEVKPPVASWIDKNASSQKEFSRFQLMGTTDERTSKSDPNREFETSNEEFVESVSRSISSSYELGRQLGIGGFGLVYLAFDRVGGGMAALKIPRKDRLNDKRVLARFNREIQVLKSLDHPAIIKLQSAGNTENQVPYFAMELLEGLTLEQLVNRNGPLTFESAVSYAIQILEALEYARIQGVTHRDIAPKNIFLEANNRIRIVDWGLAKFEGGHQHDYLGHFSTSSGEFWGTPNYAAPEQIKDFSRADFHADVYATGWTLVYLLTAKRPGMSLQKDGDKIRLDSGDDHLLSIRPETPSDLVMTLKKMLAYDFRQRLGTPGAAAEALRHVLSRRPRLEVRQQHAGTRHIQKSKQIDWIESLVERGTHVLENQGSTRIKKLCEEIHFAIVKRSSDRPIRIAVVGPKGGGKTELLRGLVPELPELNWQKETARLTRVKYAELGQAVIKTSGGRVIRSFSVQELTSEIEKLSNNEVFVEIQVPSDLLSRGIVFSEVRWDDTPETNESLHSALLSSDLVLFCIPPDLGALSDPRLKTLLFENGHRAILWVVTRMDTIRRQVERQRIINLGTEHLTNLTSLKKDGVNFISTVGNRFCIDANGIEHELSHIAEILLNVFGLLIYEVHLVRPIQLLQRAIEIASTECGAGPEFTELSSAVSEALNSLNESMTGEVTMPTTVSIGASRHG